MKKAHSKGSRGSKSTRHISKSKESVPEKYPHFRHYLKSGHPALIVAERSSDEYNFRKVMHAEKDGGRTNEKIVPNPNPRDTEPMYIGKRVRHDNKKFFGKNALPWKYPKK